MALFVVKGVSLSSLFRFCNKASFNLAQTASITSAGGQQRSRPKPFDYRNKKFRYIHQPYERTVDRLDENSKVIVVDGPLASGKSEFAQRLAKQLDFKYVPQPDVKSLWKCGTRGLTYQDLDELLPSHLRLYDLETFLQDKKAKVAEGGGRAGELQLDFFTSRLFAYNDALLHLLSTGQGVVCVRSPWSDRIFAKALYEIGYLSRNGWNYYTREITRNHLCDFPRPHLVIYLDADVEQTKENIKRRNNSIETNSKVLSDGFLQSMENEYKDVVLPALEGHGALLVYPSIPDITEHEVALMTEDIEALGDLSHSGVSDDHQFGDWENMRDEELAYKRRKYQDLELAMKVKFHDRPFDAPEMLQSDEWLNKRADLYDLTPGYLYDEGYDPKVTSEWNVALGIRGVTPANKERRPFWVPA